MKDLKQILEREVLPLVNKPGRYIGGELGAVRKPASEVELRLALAFPDLYEIGMSHLGLKILYALVNEKPRFSAERVFAPWPDMEARMREAGIPLYTLETLTPLNQFDLIGFSLQYELTYTNLLTMLDLAGIPLFSAQRAASLFPLVVAGGPGAYAPAPLCDFIDLFVIGDGEDAVVELMNLVTEWKRRGERRGSKMDMLVEIARGVRGTFVPALYKWEYSPDGKLLSCEPAVDGVPRRVPRRAVPKLESSRWLRRIPVPHVGVVHDRVALEVRRGCTQGCRFCQAGMVYRPVRDEGHDELCRAAREALDETGYEEVALCALSVGDYPGLKAVAEEISREGDRGPIAISLPSLRPDRITASLPRKLSGGRRTGITFAPEAGTDRMRRRINKKINMDEFVDYLIDLRSRGWRGVKLYFMIGLPGETEDDLRGISDLIGRVARIGERGKGTWKVNVTVSSFIPKAHTPFQWERMETCESLRGKQAFLRREVRRAHVKLKFNDCESSLLEGVFSRGDRMLGRVLHRAWRMGCRFDGWREAFGPDRWRRAFAEEGIDYGAHAGLQFGEEDYLPWDMIDPGVSRAFLVSEREKSRRGEYTQDCALSGCLGCGACVLWRPDP